MKNLIRAKLSLLAVLALAALALVAIPASAHRNESSSVRSDADGDGASARCEAQAGTDPAVADTDGNGTVDGLENTDGDAANNAAESKLRTDCGKANTRFQIRRAKVVSLTDGTLKISVGKSGIVGAPLSSRVICEIKDPEQSDDNSASASRHGADDGADHDAGDDHGGNGRHGGRDDDKGADNGHHHGSGDDDTVACVSSDYAAGTIVKSAKVRHGKFVKLRLKSADAS
jgi:hypothetical protein